MLLYNHFGADFATPPIPCGTLFQEYPPSIPTKNAPCLTSWLTILKFTYFCAMKNPPLSLRRARMATMLIFLVCGIGLSSWAPMVPYAKDRLGIHDGQLGMLLLFLGFGALIMMPISGILINRFGTRIITAIGAGIIALSLPTLIIVHSIPLMAVALFFFGAGVGTIDVAMNAHGVQVQNLYGRPIMSSLHGLFSVGGLFGALGLGALVKAGLEPLHAALGISLLLVIIAASQYRYFLDYHTERETIAKFSEEAPVTSGHRNRMPWLRGSVLFLGFMCFAVFLAEGAILDWSAVFLRDTKGVSQEFSGVGYAAFSVAMATMRLLGDGLVERLSGKSVVLGGSMLASVGLALSIWSPSVYMVLLGYVLLGLGAANIVPIFFSAGGRLPGLSPNVSIPAITTIGYLGQLAGPALLGFIAHQHSLATAFGFTMVSMAAVGLVYFLFSSVIFKR